MKSNKSDLTQVELDAIWEWCHWCMEEEGIGGEEPLAMAYWHLMSARGEIDDCMNALRCANQVGHQVAISTANTLDRRWYDVRERIGRAVLGRIEYLRRIKLSPASFP